MFEHKHKIPRVKNELCLAFAFPFIIVKAVFKPDINAAIDFITLPVLPYSPGSLPYPALFMYSVPFPAVLCAAQPISWDSWEHS